MAVTNLGKVSVTPKGAWSSSFAYEFLDIVTNGGSSYLAVKAVPAGTALSNTTYWLVIASKGDKGDTGETGPKGDTGDTGNGIASIEKTSASGLVDTYTVTMTDGTTTTFTVTNASSGVWGSISGNIEDQTDLAGTLAPTFSTSTAYNVGDYCFYQGALYRFVTAKSAGAWDAACVESAVITEDMKSSLAKFKEITKYYPTYVRGSANTNDGAVRPNETVLNRLVETEYIPTAVFNRLYIKPHLELIVLYYDGNKVFDSYQNWYMGNYIDLDVTKAYVRILIKNGDSSNFDEVLADAAYFVNTAKEYQTKKECEEFIEFVSDLVYSETGTDTYAASTVRWFLPDAFSYGWLDRITIHGAGMANTMKIELWNLSGDTFTLTDTILQNVGVGDDQIFVKRVIPDDTYISFAYATPIAKAAQTLKLNSSGSHPCKILRDKDSQTFQKSALENFDPYSIAVDVYWCRKEKTNTHTYSIGQNDNVAEIIEEAMNYENSIVYIEPYEHDCIAEWEAYYGTGYFANMSSGRGMELRNGVHIIGRSGHKLKCYYTGDNDYVMENFSLFNNPSGGRGYILENVCIDTKKIRYCIHDERGSDTTPYIVKYLRCIMSQDMTGSTWDHSRACIGGGLGQHGDVLVDGCIFSTVTSQANMDSLAYHNSAGSEAQNSLVIKNCYCTGDSTLQLASYGTSPNKTKVLVSSCSFGSAIEIFDWTGGSPNLEIYQINNEIRNS